MNCFLFRAVLILFFSVYFSGCSEYKDFNVYAGKDPELAVMCKYPKNWHYSEQKGSHGGFTQVIFYDSADPKELKPSITITSEKKSFERVAVQTKLNELISKRLRFKDSRICASTRDRVSSIIVPGFIVEYKTLSNLYSTDSSFTPVKEYVVITEDTERFYIIRYESPAADFLKYEKMFKRCLSSLKFIKVP